MCQVLAAGAPGEGAARERRRLPGAPGSRCGWEGAGADPRLGVLPPSAPEGGHRSASSLVAVVGVGLGGVRHRSSLAGRQPLIHHVTGDSSSLPVSNYDPRNGGAPPEVVTDFPHKVRVVPHAWVTMSDGVRLAAKLWIPEDAEDHPVPAILEYIPYRKNDCTAVRDNAMHAYFAGHGYVSVRPPPWFGRLGRPSRGRIPGRSSSKMGSR